MQITKAMRYQIIKPLNCSWDELGEVLRELSYYTARMCNAAIQMYWEYHNRRLEYKKERRVYPTDRDLGYNMSFRNHVYHALRSIYPLMASNNVSQTNQYALKKWQAELPDVMRLAKSIPSFRLGTPIHVAGSNYKLKVGGEDFIAEVTLLSREAPLGRFTLLLNAGDKTKAIIFRRIAEGTYKQGAMQILQHKRKKKWFCLISYTFTAEEKEIEQDRIMGIALGLGSAINWAFSHGPKRGEIPADEIVATEKKIAAIEARRRNLQHTAGKEGHGRKRKLLPTEALSRRARNIREALNHKYSRRIVDIAVANRCGIIRIAEPNGLKNPKEMANWPWADLIQKITYKAQEKGIKIEKTELKKAMITCSKCGYTDEANIGDNKEFMTCKNPNCGTRINIEYNTAKVLADIGTK